jgi:anti-sigma factor RsiW
MNCRKLVELLVDFVAGELAPGDRELIERHLNGCPPCVAYLETYQLTIQLTRRLTRDSMPPACEQRLRAALKEITRGDGIV